MWHPFAEFYDGQTESWELISHRVCSTRVFHSQWYKKLTVKFQETNQSTQKLWTNNFYKSPDLCAEQNHQLTLTSFPGRLHHKHLYIQHQSFCTITALCCHSWMFYQSLFSFLYEFQLHFFLQHASNDRTQFTFGRRLFWSMFMGSLCT